MLLTKKRATCTYVLREWRVVLKVDCSLLLIESESNGQFAAFSLDLPRGGSGGEVRPLARRRCVSIHVEIIDDIALHLSISNLNRYERKCYSRDPTQWTNRTQSASEGKVESTAYLSIWLSRHWTVKNNVSVDWVISHFSFDQVVARSDKVLDIIVK